MECTARMTRMMKRPAIMNLTMRSTPFWSPRKQTAAPQSTESDMPSVIWPALPVKEPKNFPTASGGRPSNVPVNMYHV